MSNTVDMVCKDCKEEYWFGQGRDSSGWTMYKQQMFMNWLMKHREHELIIFDEDTDIDNYKWYRNFKKLSYEDMESENG